MMRIVLCFLGLCLAVAFLPTNTFANITSETEQLNLRDFGAIGDGVADDGPAFQKALDALAAAGGGTLFIPEGKYSIGTPVAKNFTGLATDVAIIGVESLTPLAPPTSEGSELATGLDLLSEVYPRTGETQSAITIIGLRSLLVKDVSFVGTQTVRTDAAVTLLLSDIDKAQIKHSEFYGLASLVPGGGIVKAVRSNLEITQCKFLGSITTSGWYVPVVENIEWRGITVTDTTFLDYGWRPDFYGKSYLAAPISWINIGNAAATDNHSPRREVVLRNVFLDEGGYWGLSSLPYRYTPLSAPIDLIYITGLVMNVSNFDQVGHELYDAQRVFIEKSKYGWSQHAAAAIALRNVGTGILDQLTCVADADHIYADPNTRELTVINSTYTQLDSFAGATNTINTATDEDDPVQYVRARFAAVLGREPDPAAHFYWSNLLIRCFEDSSCQDTTKAALNNYLSSSPSAAFAISGRITDEQNTALANVTVTLSGSQSVTTKTDANGEYDFTNLPTSGQYLITPSKDDYTFESRSFITPNGDRTADFTAKRPVKKHSITGRVLDTSGEPVAGVAITLSGSINRATTTAVDGSYSFTEIDAGTSCTITASQPGYLLLPPTQIVNNLAADTVVDFRATLLPALLTAPDSDRAIALELTSFVAEPFSIITTLLSDGHNRTRIIVFGINLGLLPNDGVEALSAEAEDAAGVRYPLRVEFVSPLAEFPSISQIVLRLDSGLEDAGDVLANVTAHGLTSNKVRIRIGHFDDAHLTAAR